MNLDLTATPIIVADGGGRLIYKNAAAKKLLPGCRKGTPLIRYLSAVGYDSYLQMRCDTIERHDIIVFVIRIQCVVIRLPDAIIITGSAELHLYS